MNECVLGAVVSELAEVQIIQLLEGEEVFPAPIIKKWQCLASETTTFNICSFRHENPSSLSCMSGPVLPYMTSCSAWCGLGLARYHPTRIPPHRFTDPMYKVLQFHQLS